MTEPPQLTDDCLQLGCRQSRSRPPPYVLCRTEFRAVLDTPCTTVVAQAAGSLGTKNLTVTHGDAQLGPERGMSRETKHRETFRRFP